MNAKEFGEKLTAQAQTLGAENIYVERGRKHNKLRFEHDGKAMMFVFPSSPSDSKRGIHNATADLRRMIGVTRTPSPPSEPKKKKQRTKVAPKSVMPDRFTVKPNPLNALSQVADVLNEQRQFAADAGFHAFLSGHGDEAPAEWSDDMSKAFRNGWWRGWRILS